MFLGLIGVFYVFSQLGVFERVIAPASLRLSAAASAPIIRIFGDDVRVNGSTLSSSRGEVEVAYGCDALEPMVYFAAAVLAFPAPWRKRLPALAAGLPLLFALNIVRVVSLYLIATRRPTWFEFAHRDLWQPIFIVATLLLWFAWIMLLPRARAPIPARG